MNDQNCHILKMTNQPNANEPELDPTNSSNSEDIPGCSWSTFPTDTDASSTALAGSVSKNNNSNLSSEADNDDGAAIEDEEKSDELSITPCPSWSPPHANHIVWIPKRARPEGDRDEFDDQFEVEQNYKESTNQNHERAAMTNVVVMNESGPDDEQGWFKRKEPFDKAGMDPEDGDNRRQPPPMPFIIRFINCSRHMFEVSPNLQIPSIRIKFLAKVLAVKTAQWIFLLGCIVAMRLVPSVEQFFIKTPEIGYIFMMVYITAVTSARACEYGQKLWGALFTFFIETACLVYLFGQILFSSEDYALPTTVITITLTNIVLTAACFASKADVSENGAIYAKTTSLVLVLSMLALFTATKLYPPPDSPSWLRKVCAIAFLNFMVSETYVLMEISDIHFILRGYRFPVSEENWVVVAASLF